MPDERTDRIAREAARLIETGRAGDVADAIRAAAESLAGHAGSLPSHGLVRRHVQAMAMQARGEAAYHASILAVWRSAEELMTTVEHGLPDATTLLVGRAARGLIDAGLTLHVRVYTDRAIGELAVVLGDHGYDEPVFETARTRFGRLDRLRLSEDGHEVVLTRCPTDLYHRVAERDRDLFKGRSIETVSLDGLRGRLASGSP